MRHVISKWPLPPVDGIEPAPVQISQEDLTAASHRFRRYKQVMHMYTHARTHTFLQGFVFGVPSAQYAIAASPDAKSVGGGSEMLLEVKCVCPFVEKDDGRGWVRLPFKRAPQGVSVKHFVQCQVQMLATSVSHCLLACWDVQECKVFYVPFDEVWCRQMVSMLSTFFSCSCSTLRQKP